MEKFDLDSFTKEQIAKAMECKTPEELIVVAKKAGVEFTKEQAEAYLEELNNVKLDPEALEKIAGGTGTPCVRLVCHKDLHCLLNKN